ncbi:hypothetical protein CS022_18605 [Veronia nyctiphanis]|uniref:DUF2750 domain-containing protein n=1 Tax=Veronia nyctiphanis TaxID=1278244 RepID=A0A4V1LSK4_9GAMM|nr:DUF2750 domain-containing protein [Veronia nyctiphanis]RXJ72008.1 hypothetical protein CS022_18605 [Veronia nyctiphanis]
MAEQFVKASIQQKRVWGLSSKNGWVLCDSAFFEDSEVIPFWTDEDEASQHCSGEWQGFEPEEISLDDFVSVWLSDLAEDDVLLGLEWDDVLSGIEIEAQELADLYAKHLSTRH